MSGQHPLVIDSVKVGAGLVGVTSCPGKRPVSATGKRTRDIEADVRAMCTWGATIVMCLMEECELRELDVTDLPDLVQKVGLEWLHMPIVEGSIPGVSWEARWREVGPRLHTALAAGARIVIHCNGGLGRSGTVCARLLIELGANAGGAIRTVRAARPGAIENRLQEDYVRRLAGSAPHSQRS